MSTKLKGGDEVRSGTSLAATHVAGIMALKLSYATEEITPKDMKKVLETE